MSMKYLKFVLAEHVYCLIFTQKRLY